MILKIMKLNPERDAHIELPKYMSKGAAGMDIRSCVDKTILRGHVIRIKTGLRFQIPTGWEVQIRARSGLASRGIIVANAPATVDSDYRGEIQVQLLNLSGYTFFVKRGMRIAQIIPKRVERVIVQEVIHINTDTERGINGHGSTGLY